MQLKYRSTVDDISVYDVLIITFEVKDFEDVDAYSDDNEDSTLDSIPSLKSRSNGSDDDIIIDSDESNHFYFQDDKTNIAKWLKDNDKYNNNDGMKSKDYLKPSAIDHDDKVEHINTNKHNTIGKNMNPSDIVVKAAALNDMVHNNIINNYADNDVNIIKTVDMKDSYDTATTANLVLQSTDPDII